MQQAGVEEKRGVIRQIKTILGVLPYLMLAALIVLAGFILYLELYVVPEILSQETGGKPTLMTLAHILMILFLMGGSAWLGAKLRENDIFSTQQKLVATHVNTAINAVQNLATGRWSSDSYTHRDAFKTGAMLGHKLGQAQVAGDISEAMILEGLERMALPAPAQAGGQSPLVVDQMSDYLDDIAARRDRLSG